MNNLQEIITMIRSHLPNLQSKYKVKLLEVFGSYRRGEQKIGSDIDILVEFSETIDLIAFMQLEQELSDILGNKVDLVMKDTLKPRIREQILQEAMAV